MGAYASHMGGLAAVANSAINVRISKVSDGASDRAISEHMKGVKIPLQKDGNRRRGMNSTQKTAISGKSQESVHLPAVTSLRASMDQAALLPKHPEPPGFTETGRSSNWTKLNMRPVSSQSKRVMLANSNLVNNLSILGNLENKLRGTDILKEQGGQTLKDQL